MCECAARNHTHNAAMSFIGGLLSVCEQRYWKFLKLPLASLTSYVLPIQASVHWLVLLSCLILSNSHLTWLLPSSFCACVSPISCGKLNLPSSNLCARVCSLVFQYLILCEPCYSGMWSQIIGCALEHKFGSDGKIKAMR